jgi:hypothetical protein
VKHDCPGCGRRIGVRHGKFCQHLDPGSGGEYCRLSGQRVPVTGHSDRDYETRAWTVLDLAQQVADRDPQLVWTYLTATPADELQRLLMIALAAVPVDRPIAEVFRWVYELPAARKAS